MSPSIEVSSVDWWPPRDSDVNLETFGLFLPHTPAHFNLSVELGFIVCLLHFMHICHARHYSTVRNVHYWKRRTRRRDCSQSLYALCAPALVHYGLTDVFLHTVFQSVVAKLLISKSMFPIKTFISTIFSVEIFFQQLWTIATLLWINKLFTGTGNSFLSLSAVVVYT